MLLARAEDTGSRLLRLRDQPEWRDPATGYLRKQVSPSGNIPMELTEIILPPGEEVAFPAAAYAFIRQMVWVLDGALTFIEGDNVHELSTGDCLALGPPADCLFRNGTRQPCRYLVAVLRQA
jgi:quercetin dioxygenase-like cupin family protein